MVLGQLPADGHITLQLAFPGSTANILPLPMHRLVEVDQSTAVVLYGIHISHPEVMLLIPMRGWHEVAQSTGLIYSAFVLFEVNTSCHPEVISRGNISASHAWLG